jgi:protein Xni
MHVLLIDGLNLVRRIYEARPHDNDVLDPELYTSATQSISRALRQHKPSHVCCVFDSSETTWRHELYPLYKANRKPTPSVLAESLTEFAKFFEKIGVKSITVSNYEADDVIATIATGISAKDGMTTILSTDKNFLQLLGQHIKVYDHFKDMNCSGEWVQKKYGVEHQLLLDYWALTGDSTNNIKGAPKVGPKTAVKLLTQYGTLNNLLNNLPEDKIGLLLEKHRHDVNDARELICLKTDVELGVNLNELRFQM